MLAGRRIAFVSLLPLFLLVGCRSNTNQQLLETELRTNEWMVRDLKEELARSKHLNQALMHEVSALRQHQKITPEEAAQTFGLKRIAVGRMTGGIHKDHVPGDIGLEVYIEPYDSEEHAIKAPGTLYLQALEIRPEGTKAPIGAWEVKPDDLRKLWRSGLLSSAYVVSVPWQKPPMTDSLRVVARLQLSDGRAYEADRDIRVRMSAGHVPPKLPVDVELAPPPRQDESKPPEVAPPPRPIETQWRPASK